MARHGISDRQGFQGYEPPQNLEEINKLRGINSRSA